MFKYQYPHLSASEKSILKKTGNLKLLEFLFALRKWKKYYLSTIKRAFRGISERYSNIAFTGHLNIPVDFTFDEKLAVPRGNLIDGHYFSKSYEKDLLDLPSELQGFILSFRSILESYFCSEVNVNKANIWRNYHVPEDIANTKSEVFADAFHQDLVHDQYNIQLFILLQDTDEEHGPFEFLDGISSARDIKYYRKRNRKKALSSSTKLIGKRGDYLLFTTGFTLHRAGIPREGFHRDIFSIAFFPSYTNIGAPISEYEKAINK